jgi:hypothetical protein
VRGGGESHSMLVSVDVQRIGDDAPVVADGPTGSA